MTSKLTSLERSVLERIRPSERERRSVEEIVGEITSKISAMIRSRGIKARVELEGSIAKDTWLSGEWDIDIFVLFDPALGRGFLEDALVLLEDALSGYEHRIAYAEHPYIQVNVGGTWVDVVPAFDVPDPKSCISAVDRTPHHTRYVKERLSSWQRDHVRLLKKFMKAIGVYGAEVRVSGFSGYLAELLIIYYGGFREAIEAFSKWRPPVILDLEGHYDGPEEVFRRFRHHLIVVDPVDPNRNTASAVSLTSFSRLVAAAQAYIDQPGPEFFEREKPPISREKLSSMLKGRGIICVKTAAPKLHPDVLWGEIQRTMKGLRRLLEMWGFNVIDQAAWSDEKSVVLLLFELESLRLPAIELRKGPKVYMAEGSRDFVRKHLGSELTVAGPYIAGDRWYVLRRRRFIEPAEVITARWRDASIAPDMEDAMSRGFEILCGEAVAEASDHPEYRSFLWEFLEKRPRWLR